MSGETFDLGSWLSRIGYAGAREPSLQVLTALIAAHSATIPFENIDVLLGRPPKLDLDSLQRKLVTGGRGGYCFEQNTVLRAGLRALGFQVTNLLGRVIRGLPATSERPAGHMALRVELPEGPFLADVGFGNLTPTAPLAMRPNLEQATPHETMRLAPLGDELLLQVKLDDGWENVYRLSPRPPLDIDYEVANWFTGTHPASPFVSNLIVARPGPDGARKTLFNGRSSLRQPSKPVERRLLQDEDALAAELDVAFGLRLSAEELTAALAVLDRKGRRDVAHPFFA